MLRSYSAAVATLKPNAERMAVIRARAVENDRCAEENVRTMCKFADPQTVYDALCAARHEGESDLAKYQRAVLIGVLRGTRTL